MIVMLVLGAIKPVGDLILGDFGLISAIWFVIVFLLTIYQLWVVYAFMEELKTGGSVQTAGYVHEPTGAAGSVPQSCVYYTNKPGEGLGQMPPSYVEAQGGYVPASMGAPGYPPVASAYPPQPCPQQNPSFHPQLDAEKGQKY